MDFSKLAAATTLNSSYVGRCPNRRLGLPGSFKATPGLLRQQ